MARLELSDWQDPPDAYGSDEAIVHVWRLPLLPAPESFNRLYSFLSDDELARADRLVREEDGRKFIAARGALRLLLSRYLDEAPEQLVFQRMEFGKPRLANGVAEKSVTFNVSHSGDLGLIAIASSNELGIDIEAHRERLEADKIARRYFSPGEVDTLFALPQEQWHDAFYDCWTRKEAYIKARGEGLSLGLNTFDVSLGPDEPPALLRAKDGPEELSRWSFFHIRPGTGYTGALAVEGQPNAIRLYDLEDVSSLFS